MQALLTDKIGKSKLAESSSVQMTQSWVAHSDDGISASCNSPALAVIGWLDSSLSGSSMEDTEGRSSIRRENSLCSRLSGISCGFPSAPRVMRLGLSSPRISSERYLGDDKTVVPDEGVRHYYDALL